MHCMYAAADCNAGYCAQSPFPQVIAVHNRLYESEQLAKNKKVVQDDETVLQLVEEPPANTKAIANNMNTQNLHHGT